ncbi:MULTISPECIES: phosphatidylinositol-specific phospholipase C1-like protein [unclassified Xanthomonas]|uniref:phosphatidylinositol-specific phospholipase C1-like protein n=1 Tax=unclassified Xanthomonas TaxID=2643310 RepID=UPI002A834071|nr:MULTISPECIES: phosphatidylinositol-specific phospholipase C1-like protein [unclassified Xanthomonas]MDY4297253.1 phosphatidylinositol-specific phospholipase C1-like protein [Xanthomonas sp. LF02-5]MDY4358786.1 phosphatidylinositol-specific phospholipase C1-like protein [Xanthomonas sp. LF04-12]
MSSKLRSAPAALRALLAVLALLPSALCAAPRLGDLQYIGSHNSYHAGFAPSEAALWKRLDPATFAVLDYRHPPLTQQLDDGVRQIELDIYADAKGGRYAHPAMIDQLAKAGLPPAPPIAAPGVMQRPGFKVMHIQDLDQRSTCQPLLACLREVRAWSQRHPGHLPIFILLETKQSTVPAAFPTVQPEPFDGKALDALDAELRSVFAANDYISPDQVRGSAATLNAAVLAQGWPALSAARGKVVFLLDQRSIGPAYLAGHPSLRGRVCFTNADPGADDAAFVERNDGSADEIATLVKAGYLVRTRTDADLKEALRNDTARRDAMLASGAQLLSTDFPDHEPAASGYVVRFPDDAVARCNPQRPQRPQADCHGVDLRH